MVVTVILVYIALALVSMALTAVLNALLFPRLRPAPSEAAPDGTARLSVLIPARNEAAVISATVQRLLAQDYPHLEVIVLDDDSDDDTAAVARAAANDDNRLRVLSGAPLPPGWAGKNWACHQLGRAATGDILIFTDADVRWHDGALSALVHLMKTNRADLQTIWPTQRTETWGERLIVPLMMLVILAYLPIPLVHRTRRAMFAAANGQCLAFRRRAYAAVGGHAAARSAVVEDIVLARRIKQAGLRLRMADGANLIACRMYDGWPAARDGFAKNILAGYGDRVVFLALATVFHWAVFIAPPLLLLVPGLRLWGGLLTVLGVGVRALTAATSGQRVGDALLLPISALLMTRVAAQAIWWRWRYGGPRWKGRTISRTESPPPDAPDLQAKAS